MSQKYWFWYRHILFAKVLFWVLAVVFTSIVNIPGASVCLRVSL